MIAEVAAAGKGGDKAGWISAAFNKTIHDRMPETRGVIWFSSNNETDWRVDSSGASLRAYRKVAADPSYGGRLP